MTRQAEPSEAYKTSLQCVQDSNRWFGDTVDHRGMGAVIHHTLSLCGEAGEVANLIKKIERGSLDIRDAKVKIDLTMELADVYTYLCNLAGLLGIDLQRAYEVKRVQNELRFSQQRKERDAKRANTAGAN